MLFRSADSQSFKARDNTILKEIFHPKGNGLKVPFSLASGYLEIGESSFAHTLEQSETYFIIEGKAEIVIEDEVFEVCAGDCVFVKKGAIQYVRNTGNCKLGFLCIVAPPWTEKGEEIHL